MLLESECHRGSLSIAKRGARRLRGVVRPRRGIVVALLSLALGLMSAGCGSNLGSSPAKAGVISVINSSGKAGAVTQLAILDTLQLSMMPSGDTLNAGVDWTVICGGNPRTGSTTSGGCGILVPAHTADGAATVYTGPSAVPINQTVTITATVTSNPSQTNSLTFTIVPSSIGVSISVSTLTPADTLQIDKPVYISYTVVNDPLDAGVTLTATCGSANCGAFSSTKKSTYYIAPSAVPAGGGTVTLTATSVTDTTKSAYVKLTIVDPPAAVPVTLNLYPTTLNIQTGRTSSLTAFVGNDSAAAGVDWSVSCTSANCGVIGPPTHSASGSAAPYLAPTSIPIGGTVTITARSTTNPLIYKTATATVLSSTLIAVSNPSTLSTTMAVGSTATLTATSTDTSRLGVDWTAACGTKTKGACGTFNPSHTDGVTQTTTYTAPASIPAGGTVAIVASSSSANPASQCLSYTTIVAPSPSLTFTQTPTTPMTATTQTSVSATVANDVAPGGVNWTVCSSTSPSNCGDPSYGYVYPSQTASGATAIYTAPPTPPGTSVVVQATSVADSSVSIASSPITIAANTTPSVSFIPSLPGKVQPDGTVNLVAAVANDSTSGGVDWQVCGSGCGYFTISPAVPAIPATSTTAYQAPVEAKITTSVSGWPSGTPLPYTAPPQIPSSGSVTVTVTAHADNTKTVSGAIAIDTDATGPALNGKVVVGTAQSGATGTVQYVAGSSVALYVAGTNGSVNKITNGVVEIEYLAQATQIALTTTGTDGSFTIPAGYACPSSSSQMYLVASGGSVGIKRANANLALMTALGSCGNLSSTPVVVNEATTVASAFALGPFSANDALYGTSSYLYLGTSASNITGLVNSFAAVNNLVDITSGLARSVTPAGNGLVPYAYINDLADMLNACAVTSGGVEGDGSACGTLLYGTDLLNLQVRSSTYLGSNTPPTDTLQAAFNLAQVARYNGVKYYQLNSTASLFALATTASPFQPIQTLTGQYGNAISIHYTGGGGISSASTVGSLAVDASGNVWITDSNAGTVAEWNAMGAPVVGAQVPSVWGNTFAESPFTTTSGGGPMAIDASGNVWVSGNGKLAEITSSGTQAPGSPFKGVAGGGSDMAIDQQNYIWLANGSGVVEFDNTGALVSPASGWTYSTISNIFSIGVDGSSSHNIWAGNTTTLSGRTSSGIAELSDSYGQLIANGGGQGSIFPQMAADSKGNMYVLTGTSGGFGNFCSISPYTEQDSTFSLSCNLEDISSQNNGTIPISDGQGLAFDGRGTLWVADSGVNTVLPSSTGEASLPGVAALYPGGAWSGGVSNASGASSTQASSLAVGTLRVAIDGSGNIWVLLSDNTVTEFVGEATPVVTPAALALKNGKLATMP